MRENKTGSHNEKLEKRLIELLNLDKNSEDKSRSFCITLSGKWGAGKTYFWNEFIKDVKINNEKFKIKKFAYISLFGMENLEEIRGQIVLQAFKTENKSIGIANKILDSSKNIAKQLIKKHLGVNVSLGLGSLFSYMDKNDLKDVIVCFDDIERKSSNLEMKDFLGLVSELKEQKNCDVVMILNEKELEDNKKDNKENQEESTSNTSTFDLEKDNKCTFYKYYEKVVDYSLVFKPEIKDCFEIVKGELNAFKDLESAILNYFKRTNVNNIRIMRKAINALNDYGFMEDEHFSTYKEELCQRILEIATVKAIYRDIDFTDISRDNINLILEIGNKNSYEKVRKYFVRDSFIMDSIYLNIINYMTSSIVDKEDILTMVEEEIKNNTNKNILDEIYALKKSIIYNLSLDIKQSLDDIYIKIKDIICDDSKSISLSEFIYLIGFIRKFDSGHSVSYEKLVDEGAVRYIDYLEKNNRLYNYREQEELQSIFSFSKKAKEHYLEKKQNLILSKYKKDEFKDILSNIYLEDKFSRIDLYALNNVDEKYIKGYILEDFEINRLCIKVLQRHFINVENSFFKEFGEKVIKIYQDLKENGNDSQKIQAKNILKTLSISQ